MLQMTSMAQCLGTLCCVWLAACGTSHSYESSLDVYYPSVLLRMSAFQLRPTTRVHHFVVWLSPCLPPCLSFCACWDEGHIAWLLGTNYHIVLLPAEAEPCCCVGADTEGYWPPPGCLQANGSLQTKWTSGVSSLQVSWWCKATAAWPLCTLLIQ